MGDQQWIQYGKDESTRFAIPAVRTSVGTFPEGSEWTKNPIPACAGNEGGAHDPDGKCKEGTQFPSPGPGLYGFGCNYNCSIQYFKFSIIDTVQIPQDLQPGKYVMSFRWDCEQTGQVWNSCADIMID